MRLLQWIADKLDDLCGMTRVRLNARKARIAELEARCRRLADEKAVQAKRADQAERRCSELEAVNDRLRDAHDRLDALHYLADRTRP